MIKLKFFLFFVLSCILFVKGSGYAQTPKDNPYSAQIQKFEEYVKSDLKKGDIAGLSAAFSFQGYEWANGYGYADLENKLPATAKSSYRMASVSKPMTAVGILVLVQQGKVNLDKEVQEYVPYYPKKRWPITIRQILGHLSGISHYRDYEKECGTTKKMTTREGIAIFKEWDLLHKPGSEYQYTSYGYNLLGAVIEEVSGQSYEKFMEEQVWQKIGMENTGVDYLYDLIPGRVRGYRKLGNKIQNTRPVSTSLKVGGGGTRSTVIDMVRFAQGLNQGKLLSQDYLDKMWTSMITTGKKQTRYGMGWTVANFKGRFTASHSGEQEGTRTYLLHFPSHKLTVAIASNLESTNPRYFAQLLASAILGDPIDVPRLYTGNWLDNIRLRALQIIFREGLAYFDRYKVPKTTEKKEMQSAFEYINQFASDKLLTNTKDRGAELIANGRHPKRDWAFVKVGSYIADILHQKYGDQHLSTYFREGQLKFFADYIKIYHEGSNTSNLLTFSPKLENSILTWNKNWEQIWTTELQDLNINVKSEPVKLGKHLKTVFKGYTSYPDFSQDFSGCVYDALEKESSENAMNFAKAALELYPKSDLSNSDLGILYYIFGKESKGKKLIEKAISLNPQGSAGHRGLNRIAYRLKGMGKIDEGKKVLQLALEFYPKEANLYDSMGEFYLEEKEYIKAIKFYVRALEVNPKFQNAKNMLLKAVQGLIHSEEK